jgi:hypothetical protein
MGMTDKMILNEGYLQALSRHYDTRKALETVLNKDELLLLNRILVEEKVRMKLLEKNSGYVHPDKEIFESLYEKIYGPLWEKYSDN